MLREVQLTALTTKPSCIHTRNGHHGVKARGLGSVLGSADTLLAHETYAETFPLKAKIIPWLWCHQSHTTQVKKLC